MNVYLDASALVKRYVAESGSREVGELIKGADSVVTAIISRAEVGASLAKAVRMRVMTENGATAARQTFRNEWDDLGRLPVSEAVVNRAEILAWEHGLRGYDAVHLAAALLWQEAFGRPVTLATYDRQLWSAARATGLNSWPEGLATG